MKKVLKYDFWVEWKSWALPLRIGALGDYAAFEIQIGPFGFTVLRLWRDQPHD